MADESGKGTENASLNSKEAEKRPIEPLRLPTPEEIRGQDIWNNCAMRSVVSGVMGITVIHFFHFSFSTTFQNILLILILPMFGTLFK